LEVLADGHCDIEFESFNEFMISSDAHNWVEEPLEAGHLSFLGGMGGGIVFLDGPG
jgi:hypothetical protein